jgi:hypothetical protein
VLFEEYPTPVAWTGAREYQTWGVSDILKTADNKLQLGFSIWNPAAILVCIDFRCDVVNWKGRRFALVQWLLSARSNTIRYWLSIPRPS